MQDRGHSSDDWISASGGADDDTWSAAMAGSGGGSAGADSTALGAGAAYAAQRRGLWNYTATVHFGAGLVAARPVRGTVVAANITEARDHARAAAEEMFRAYGQAMAVIVTRLW